MKRDMELVRKILLALEENEAPQAPTVLEVEGYTHDQIMYHIGRLYEAGLIDANDYSSADDTYWTAKNLTWRGHEFLANAKNETAWNKTLVAVKEKGGAASFAVIQAILLKYVLAQF